MARSSAHLSGDTRSNFDPQEQEQERDVIVMRVYTTATAWIVVDSSGGYATGFDPIAQPAGNARQSARQRQSPAALAQRAFGKLR